MKPQPVESKAQSFMARSLAFLVLIVLVFTACSSSAPASQSSGLTPEPASQQQAASHPPVITRVVEREEIVDGFQYTYNDIYFTDLDGDAVAVTYREVSSSLSYPFPLSDDPIQASVEEQQEEALFNFGGRCLYRMELVLESRIWDAAGNLSEPVTTRPPARLLRWWTCSPSWSADLALQPSSRCSWHWDSGFYFANIPGKGWRRSIQRFSYSA